MTHSSTALWRGVAMAFVASGVLFGVVAGAGAGVVVDGFGVVDTSSGVWYLRDVSSGETTSFYFGDPGDVPVMGDWDCDGVDTPGLYRQSDGYVYLSNVNAQGVADVKFFFGDPGDVPLAGDFDGDGCDTVSIYRPSESRVFVINELGSGDGGLGAADFDYLFGNPGDKAFVADFDGDGVDTVGLHRESTGLVYYTNTHSQGNAEVEFIYGDPGDKIVTGKWTDAHTVDTVGLFRPSQGTMFLRYENSQGSADEQHAYGNSHMVPVAGRFGTLPGGNEPPPGGMTVITDSVVLGAERYFDDEFVGWEMEIRGKPAVMLHQIEDVYFSYGERTEPTVVLAIGYNSIWRPDRENFDLYAAKFDREAEAVLELVRAKGAREIVWVTLREPSPEAIITPQQIDQNGRFGFYLPYVNERLELLAARYEDLVLTDWAEVASTPGWTYDLIHLNRAGAQLMVESIHRAVDAD
jgi:hypothetical protein